MKQDLIVIMLGFVSLINVERVTKYFSMDDRFT